MLQDTVPNGHSIQIWWNAVLRDHATTSLWRFKGGVLASSDLVLLFSFSRHQDFSALYEFVAWPNQTTVTYWSLKRKNTQFYGPPFWKFWELKANVLDIDKGMKPYNYLINTAAGMFVNTPGSRQQASASKNCRVFSGMSWTIWQKIKSRMFAGRSRIGKSTHVWLPMVLRDRLEKWTVVRELFYQKGWSSVSSDVAGYRIEQPKLRISIKEGLLVNSCNVLCANWTSELVIRVFRLTLAFEHSFDPNTCTEWANILPTFTMTWELNEQNFISFPLIITNSCPILIFLQNGQLTENVWWIETLSFFRALLKPLCQ